jgi:dolichol kinase
MESVRSSLAAEAKRKAIHLSGLSVPASILLFGKGGAIAFVATALVAALFLERRRLSGKISLPAVRDSEKKRVAGYIYYITGALLAVVLFPPAIAIAAMLMLSLGDAASGIIGSVVRGSAVRTRIMEGQGWRAKPIPVVVGTFAACLLAGYAASLIEGSFLPEPFVLSAPVYAIGAAAATFADAVPLSIRKRVIDDNFSIPVLSGLAMFAVSLL